MRLPLLWRAAAGVETFFGALALVLAAVLFIVGTIALTLLILVVVILASPVGLAFIAAFKLKDWSERHV